MKLILMTLIALMLTGCYAHGNHKGGGDYGSGGYYSQENTSAY